VLAVARSCLLSQLKSALVIPRMRVPAAKFVDDPTCPEPSLSSPETLEPVESV
jgi:hypothetical protein